MTEPTCTRGEESQWIAVSTEETICMVISE